MGVNIQEVQYERRAYYHETDQMGVIHHANYIKWLEEARIYFMDCLGFSYRKTEEAGIISPVLGIDMEYKLSVRFDEEVYITVRVAEYSGVRLELSYEIIRKDTGKLCAVAHSRHCFIKGDRVVSLKRELPELHRILAELSAGTQ